MNKLYCNKMNKTLVYKNRYFYKKLFKKYSL